MRGLLIVAALASATPGYATELVIGRWCDHPIPTMAVADNIIAIKITDDGAMLERQFQTSTSEAPLDERGGDTYFDGGDGYRIVSSSGDLQLLDGDGLIRVAKRLENTPQTGECLR